VEVHPSQYELSLLYIILCLFFNVLFLNIMKIHVYSSEQKTDLEEAKQRKK